LPKNLKSSLPSIKQIEAELSGGGKKKAVKMKGKK
jgi:hypothetical protein